MCLRPDDVLLYPATYLKYFWFNYWWLKHMLNSNLVQALMNNNSLGDFTPLQIKMMMQCCNFKGQSSALQGRGPGHEDVALAALVRCRRITPRYVQYSQWAPRRAASVPEYAALWRPLLEGGVCWTGQAGWLAACLMHLPYPSRESQSDGGSLHSLQSSVKTIVRARSRPSPLSSHTRALSARSHYA